PSFNQEPELKQQVADFINEHESDILNGTYQVPPAMPGGRINQPNLWNPPGVNNPDARQKFSLGTCNGCHFEETLTHNFHVSVRSAYSESMLSGYLTGITTADPVTGEPRTFKELERRKQDLEAILNGDGGQAPTAGPAPTADARH